ncbi:MAG: hypothetical protein SFW36_20965 [Leptolyngbyaceae cyanobacterium bins.59]|nr:hypothetical protein [Leptolyngbyaceae cyanobacterium bins.59]
MDDRTLAAQYAQTRNLMDLCHCEAWLRESAEIEDEVSGQVEAGLGIQEYHRTLNSLTPAQSQQLRQQMRLQSILFSGLRQWMDSWDIGARLEDTYMIARRLIRTHLANPTSSQQNLIEELLQADAQKIGSNQSSQPQVLAILSALFTPEDWQVMSATASQAIASRVLSARSSQTDTAVA